MKYLRCYFFDSHIITRKIKPYAKKNGPNTYPQNEKIATILNFGLFDVDKLIRSMESLEKRLIDQPPIKHPPSNIARVICLLRFHLDKV